MDGTTKRRLGAALLLAGALMVGGSLLGTPVSAAPGGQGNCPVPEGWTLADSSSGSVDVAGGSLDWDDATLEYSVNEGYILDVCIKSGSQAFPDGDKFEVFEDLTGDDSITIDQDISHIVYRFRTVTTTSSSTSTSSTSTSSTSTSSTTSTTVVVVTTPTTAATTTTTAPTTTTTEEEVLGVSVTQTTAGLTSTTAAEVLGVTQERTLARTGAATNALLVAGLVLIGGGAGMLQLAARRT